MNSPTHFHTPIASESAFFARAGQESHNALSVLIVEDEPGDYALIASCLRSRNFFQGDSEPHVVWTTTLAHGITAVCNGHFDIVLLDLSLPDSRGVQTVLTMTTAPSCAPVVVLTGHDDDELAMAAIGAGAQDYLVKGEFDQRSLGRAIRYAVARGALESRLQLFEVALNSVASGIIITDVDGHIEWANDAFVQMTGYSVEEARRHNPRELLNSGHQTPAFYRQMWQTILSGQIWRGELVNRRQDGSLYDVLLAISPVIANDKTVVHFVAIQQDMTEYRQSQRRLLQSEERLELALAGSDLGLWDWHIPSGNLYFSTKIFEILGYGERDIQSHIGQWEKLVHPDDAHARRMAIHTHLNGDTHDFQTEHRLRHKLGHWVWVRSRGRVVAHDDKAAALRVAGTMQEISQEKRLKLEGSDLLLRIESLIGQLGQRPEPTGHCAETDPSMMLSPRQREVIQMIAKGRTSMAIAEHLRISTATAVTHRRDLMRKLNLHSVAELTRYAIEHKLIAD